MNNKNFYTPLLIKEEYAQKMILRATEILRSGQTFEEVEAKNREVEKKAGRDIPEPRRMSWEVRCISEIHRNVAVIQVHGAICHRRSFWSWWNDQSDIETIKEALDYFIENENIDSIILDFDSPGGTVDGVEELAQHIARLKEIKPIYGIANNLAASAAYWIASACSKLFLSSKTSEVGSIGVLVVHGDFSKMLEEEGIKFTLIKSTEKKALTPSFEPLSEEGREDLQRQVNSIHDVFVATVSRNREIEEKDLRANLEGMIFFADEAVKNGLGDEIRTLDSMIKSFSIKLEERIEMSEKLREQLVAEESETFAKKDLTLATLQKDFPDIYTQAFDEGRDSQIKLGEAQAKSEKEANDKKSEKEKKISFNEGYRKGRIIGAEQERKRVMKINKSAQRGFEDLVKKSIADGTVSADDFVLKQAKELTNRGGMTIDKLEKEGAPVDFVSSEEKEKTKKESLVDGIVSGAKAYQEQNA